MEFLTYWKLQVDIDRVIEFSSIDSFDVVAYPVFMFSLTTLSYAVHIYHDHVVRDRSRDSFTDVLDL